MRGTAIVRVAAPAVLSAVLAAGWPVLERASAAPAIAPDFANSSVAIGGTGLSLAQAAVHPIRTISSATVAFTQDLAQSWTDNSNPVSPAANASTLCVESTGAAPKCVTDPSTTAFPQSNVMQVAVPATLPDGVYRLKASYWSSSCHDVTPVVQPQDPNCTGSSGSEVVDPSTGQPFQFTVDDTAPAAPTVNAPAAINAAGIHAVTISGSAEPGSDVVVTVASSGGGSMLFANPGGTTAGSDGSWSITPSLASVADGTLTIAATASDVAGNVSAPGNPATAPVLQARPSAPPQVVAYAGDSSIGVAWTVPISTGGDVITGYKVTYADTTAAAAAQTTTVAASARSALLSGLTNGHAYAITVAALNGAGAGAPAATTATPKTRTVLSLTPSYDLLTYGGRTILIGRLARGADGSGLGAKPITVTTKYDNGTAGPTYHATTDEFGYWQITGVRPAKNARYTATFAGDATDLSVASAPVRVLVRAVVRISKAVASSRSHRTAVRLTGAVSPNERGRRVYVYEVVGHRTIRVGTATLTSSSTWAFSHTWSRGTHYVIARFASQNGIQGNTSNKIKLVRS